MLYPTIADLTKGNFNRYELAIATAKCARLITDEYVRQHDVAEKSQTGNKETDKPINTMIDRELRDEKAVKVAIGRLYRGEYEIDLEAGNAPAQVVAEEIEPEAVVDVEITTADEQDNAADEALQDGDETAE
jgi:DNA-directed RNA polymerase subunit K/omega